MAGWNYADVWEVVADVHPDHPALVHLGAVTTWAEMDRRADGIAAFLLDSGLTQQSKVAQYLYNGSEYLESIFGIWKAACVPVNTNYRYAADELVYLWDNADAEAVIFHGTFTEAIEGLRAGGRIPKVKAFLWVDDSSGPCPAWATPYEEAAARGASVGRIVPPWGRSGDDLYMLYTGGTTGMPKGVMWRQDDLLCMFNESNRNSYPVDGGLDGVRAQLERVGTGFRFVPAAPLMHGTGAVNAFAQMLVGGTIITLGSRSFDVAEFLETVERERVQSVALVGDAFCKPILAALDAEPGKWDLSSLRVFISSGVMWSKETKEGLLRHIPRLTMVDAFSSSEAMGMGQSIASKDKPVETAKFAAGDKVQVFTEDGRRVQPGSGESGMLAIRGYLPLGYYKDEAKSASTFKLLEGHRWSIPGDFATVESDGTITVLGRGSVCINTGGEKVFPEEVEEVVKLHPSVADAVVVGVPDERFGQAITAVVELHPGAELDEPGVIAHVKGRLAAYKAPKRVLQVATIGRAPNGKVDYKRHTAWAVEALTP